MGIRLLNTFLNAQNVRGIKKKEHFSFLKRKSVCIDISIYLYKFKQLAAVANNIDIKTGELLEDPHTVLLTNMNNMVNVLRKYQCEPIVIFDGKPPKEKDETIEERQQTRKVADRKKTIYKQMLMQRHDTLSADCSASLCEKVANEIKNSISITKSDVDAVKNMLDESRVKYIQCHGEADGECLRLVKKGEAWAVMSDDTDFIAQCCKRVLRNVDFNAEQYDFINTQQILYSLHIQQDDFKVLCVLAGCDYYKLDSQINIFKLYEYYCKYWKFIEKQKIMKKTEKNEKNEKNEIFVKTFSKSLEKQGFLSWLSKYITFDIEEIQNIINTHMSYS